MTDFTPAVAWSGKDALSDGDSNKIVSGSDFHTEFAGVQTAVNSKYDSNDLGVTLQQYDADTAKKDTANTWTLAQTFSATALFSDNTLQRANFLDCGVVTNAIGSVGGGAQTIDLTLGNAVTATIDTATTTFTFSNPTSSDEMCGFTLALTNGSSQTVNWPASVDWAAATAPTLTASGVDHLVFFTYDGGTIWNGSLVGAAFA